MVNNNKCRKCNCTLSIAKAHMEFEGDSSRNTETKAFNVLDMVCTNPKCSNYTKDLENPTIILDTLKLKMN